MGEKSENIACVKQGVDIISLCRGREEFIATESFNWQNWRDGENRNCRYQLGEKTAIIIFFAKEWNSGVGTVSLFINKYGTSERISIVGTLFGSQLFQVLEYGKFYDDIIQGTELLFTVYDSLSAAGANLDVTCLYFGDPLSYDGSTITIPETVRVLLDVKPNPHPVLSYTNFNGSTTTHSSDISATTNTDTTLIIFPKYTRQEDGTYTATVNLTDIEARSVQLSDTDKSNRVITEGNVSSDSGNLALRNATGKADPTEGAKEMTNKWCDKLKADYGSNLRLYVIERGIPSGANMSYIEQCATAIGGKVKKASNAAQLKAALDEIVADLKTFEEYQEARVLDEST